MNKLGISNILNQKDSKSDLKKIKKKFQRFPNDFTHCLLTNHVITYNHNSASINDDNNYQNCFKCDSLKYKLLQDQFWKIYEIFEYENYIKSILYINDYKEQLVLSFRGIQLRIEEFYQVDDENSPRLYAKITNQLLAQTFFAYSNAFKAVELAKEKNYHLSFTGYSFDGLLAEQCVFFCHKDFGYKKVRAVVFDSPGLFEDLDDFQLNSNQHEKEFMIRLNDLDIITYLTGPNFVNTSNNHIGKVYALKMDPDSETCYSGLVKNEFLDKIIQKKNLIKYPFYLNGLKILFTHADFDSILSRFNPEIGKPLEENYFKVIEWPRLYFWNKKIAKNNNFYALFANQVKTFTHLAKTSNNLMINQLNDYSRKQNFIDKIKIGIITENLFSQLSIIYSITIQTCSNEDLNALVNPVYKHLNEPSIKPSKNKKILDKNLFAISFKEQCQLKRESFYKEIVDTENMKDINYLLFKLGLTTPNELAKIIENNFIREELLHLKSQYTIENDSNKHYSIVSSKVDLNFIKENLYEIVSREPSIKEMIEKGFNDLMAKTHIEGTLSLDRGEDLIGRETRYLKRLDELLNQNQIVCIHGRYGSGKTAIVTQYVNSLQKSDKNSFVKWIDDSSTLEKILINFEFVTNNDECFPLFKFDKLNQIEFIQLIIKYINQSSKPFLFVFNNVKNMNDLDIFINGIVNRKAKMIFILTSSSSSITQNFNKIEIDSFINKDDLVFYLKNQNLKREFIDLFHFMFNNKKEILPIRLKRLVKHIKTHSNWSYAQIESYLVEEEKNCFYLIENDENKLISFEILKYLSFLNGSFIDKDLINLIFINMMSSDVLNESLDYLNENFFIRKIFKFSKIGYSIHETIQIEMRNRLHHSTDELKEKILNTLSLSLNSFISFEKLKNKPRLVYTDFDIVSFYEQSIELLKENWTSKYKNENVQMIYKKLAFINFNKLFNYENSLKYLNESMKIALNIYSNDDNYHNIKIGYLLRDTGIVYARLNEYANALRCLRETYSIYKRNFSVKNVQIANLLETIGNVLIYFDMKKAVKFLIKSYKIKKEIMLSDNLLFESLTNTLSNIAEIYSKIGNNIRAIKYYKKALDIKRTNNANDESDHSGIAQLLTSIGSILLSLDLYSDAKKFHKKALKLCTNVSVKADFVCMANVNNNIGIFYLNSKQKAKSLHYFKRAIELYENILPENHILNADILNNIGNLFSRIIDKRESLKFYEESLKIKRKCLPPTHLSILNSLINLAFVNECLDNYDVALAYYYEAFFIYKCHNYHRLFDITGLLNNIGIVFRKRGQILDSILFYNLAFKINAHIFNKNHPVIALNLNNLGVANQLLKNNNQALYYYSQALCRFKNFLPKNHLVLADVLVNRALILKKLERFQEALEDFKEALKISKSNPFLINLRSISKILINIGYVHLILNDRKRAIESFIEAKTYAIKLNSLTK